MKCEKCDVGYFQNEEGLPSCTKCIPGQYQDDKGKTVCKECQQGQLDAGKIPARNTSTVCEDCEYKFLFVNLCVYFISNSNDIVLFSFFPCITNTGSTGLYQTETGSTFCLPCLTGTYQNELGSSGCKNCSKGYSNGGTKASECSKCKEGRYNELEKQSSCKGCQAGKYSTEEGLDAASKCSACNAGTYSKAIGATSKDSCIDCQPGKKGTEVGASNETACSNCGKGEYRGGADDTKTCLKCPPGRNSSEGSVSCSSCSAGQYVETSTDSCLECPAGYVSKDQDSNFCTPCGKGVKGESSNAGGTTCMPCDLGRFQSTPGVCQDCKAGQYADGKGQKSCTTCPIDTYLSEFGKSSKADCSLCNADRSTGLAVGNVGNATCLCKRGAYYQNDQNECVACPVGGDCSGHDGLTLDKVATLPGYWRANATTVVFTDCKVAFSASLNASVDAEAKCIGVQVGNSTTVSEIDFNPDDQCILGSGGPSCMSCVDGYAMLGSECKKCNPSILNVVGVVAGLMVILFGIFAVMFMKAKEDDDDDDGEERGEKKSSTRKTKKGCCGGKKKQRKKKKMTNEQKIENERDTNAAGRLVSDQVLIARMSTDTGNGDGYYAYREDSHVVADRIKVFYGWMQIFTALTFTFDIPWPIQLKSLSLGLGFINLDIGFVSTLSCDMAIPFLQRMAVHAALPLVLLLIIVTARLPAHFIAKKEHRKAQKSLMVKLISSLALILYPGLCTKLFASLKEVTVAGLESATHSGQVLAVDYGVEAFGEEHHPYVILCIVCMVVYVLGIPLAVFLALRNNRKYLYSAGDTEAHRQRHYDVVDELGTLYLQYEPKYWYWEVIIIFKKMLLTGAMTVIAAGSSAQLVIALLIVLMNLLLMLKLAPFVDEADDYLSFLTSGQMFLTLQGGLLIMTDDPIDPTYDVHFMGIAMLAINGVGFVALIVSLMTLHPKCRKRLNRKNKQERRKNMAGERSSRNNATKVVPAQPREPTEAEDGIRNWSMG